MDREDAQLALQRHATSKIRTAADLIGVGTFGFRGEALPAIASVSRFELETCGEQDAALRLRVTGGKLDATEASARQRGTTVTVRGLFYNTPARRKFLRASATETRAAVEAVTVLALTRPDVGFSLTSDGRALLRSEEHTSELQSRFGISYAVFCLEQKSELRSRFGISYAVFCFKKNTTLNST